MNEEELRAEQWLENQGYSDILDLSKDNLDPPDFVVENRIAVEVRRLNWMGNSSEGVESDEHTLTSMIEEVLEKAGEPPGRQNVYVKCMSHDVLLDKRKDRELVKHIVAQFVDQYTKKIDKALKSGEHPQSWTTEWKCGIRLRFSSGLISRTARFQLVQVEVEAPSRGWEVPDSIDNINRCIVDKTNKIQDRIHCYPEWWLVLVPHNIFTPGSWEQDRWQTIQDKLVDTKPWSRIVVIGRNESWTDPVNDVELIEQKRP